MVFVEIGRGSARILDKCIVIGVSASDCIHSYSVLTYLQFSRIDSVFSTVEIGVSACNPNSLRDCPSETVTCPSFLMWANTSQYVDTESTSPNRSP